MSFLSRTVRRLADNKTVAHHVGDQIFYFDWQRLASSMALPAYLRVVADMIEEGVDFDLPERIQKSEVMFLADEREEVCSMLVYEFVDSACCVRLAWTHPGMRRLGLFTYLMNQLIPAGTESSLKIQMSPPVHDATFNQVVARLGFQPVCWLTEYRPFS